MTLNLSRQKRTKLMENDNSTRKFGEGLVIFAPLIAIGVGLWWVYPPSALIGVGLLMWIDISKGK